MIEIVVAIARSRVIGLAGGLPWHLPGDLRHFKELTLGRTVLMGRATWESLPTRFRPLPQRRNIVISRNADYKVPGAELFTSLDDGLAAAGPDCSIIGGAQIFAATLPIAARLRITYVDADAEGDTFFPALDPHLWALIHMSEWQLESGIRYRFEDFERVS